MSSKKVEPHTDSNKRYHLWLDQSLAKEDIDYMFFDPASDREYTVNIRMGSSDWLYLVMLSYDNGEPDGWYEHLNPDLRGGYMYDELSALKVDIIRLLRERFPAVEGWNDDLLPHYDKPINICYSSPFYPKEFYNYFDFDFIKGDAPFALDVVGDIRLLRRAPYFQSRVAIIGSRKPDEHGLDVAYRLGQYHSSEIVVSGLALGIDTAAHRGCLDTGGRTIAVVGSGLDRVHPKRECRDTGRNNIARRSDCVGAKIGTKASPKTLIARTRIQMAMADKVVVVQCERESGTMQAVEFAHRFRRPIFALDCDWSGNRYLIDNQIAIPFKM